jgi:hypothetical protein
MYIKNWFELSPVIDSHKSFYGKAKAAYVYDNSGVCGIVLKSYNTNVCFITSTGAIYRLWDDYSATTMRHIHDFIYQFAGTNSGGKAAWDAMPVYDYNFMEKVSV